MINAIWSGATRNVTLTFDMPIQNVPLDLMNWILTHSGGTANPMSTSITGAQIVLQFGALSGVTQIQYAPPPFDVLGSNGLAAEGFTEAL